MRVRHQVIAWSAAGFCVGVVVAVAGAVVQAHRLIVGTTAIPWGLVAVWVALVLVVRGCAWGARSRWAAWSTAIGWLAMTVILTAEGPAGDVIISGGTRQLTYLLGGVVLVSAAATLPVPRR